jgi:selenocysteine-specific elongation factor
VTGIVRLRAAATILAVPMRSATEAPRAVLPVTLGSAGHIDHGKTSLLRALAGHETDTDRLAEEQERGLTIDVGYAELTLDDGVEVGVVDVPGHERFVRNMVAGATGIDVVLFVVAADDGVMPQTREHLQIMSLLGLEVGVVAITKQDLVDEEMLDLVRADVAELVRGTFLETARVVPVSAVTGAGLRRAATRAAGSGCRSCGRSPRRGSARS